MDQRALDTYDDFVVTHEGKQTYSGVGYLHLPDGTASPCQFECGQTKHGRFLYKCWFSEEHFSTVSSWLFPPTTTFYGSGQANNKKIMVIADQFMKQIKEEYAILFSARELSVECLNADFPVELKFKVTNFEFEQSPLHWIADGHEVTLTHSKGYEEVIDRIELTTGVDITAELSINFLSSDAMCYTTRMEDIADDICHLLSLASGYKVEWLFWDALSENGQRVKSYHRRSRPTPCTPHSLIDRKNPLDPSDKRRSAAQLFDIFRKSNREAGWRLDGGITLLYDKYNRPQEPSDIKKFIDQTFETFRKRNREERWRQLREAINHYVAALEEHGFIELRALMLVVLVEDLVGSYASQRGRKHFVELSKFDKKEKWLKRGIKEVLTQVLDPPPSSRDAEEMTKSFKALNWRTFKTLLKELVESLHLNIDGNELQDFKDIRDKLVHEARFSHEARFLRPSERRGKHAVIMNANYEQYFEIVMSFVGCLMLAILGYDGTYYGWILDYSGEEPILRSEGRKMPYLSNKTS